uniref:Calpain catalytic domain-containing protein n=1 Tax=Lygus hesperus TaxID=30085 RepID=A0A0K8T1H6_LYGHE
MGTFGGVDAQALLNGVGEIIKDYASGGQITVDSIIKAVSKIRVAPNPVDLSKIKVLGERGSGFRPRSENVQDFHKIREGLLGRGGLFEDPEFPATDSSLFFSQTPSRRFEWKRPMEIVEDPRLFVEGASRFDIQQGELGDCWLLAAMANLTLIDNLFQQVVPHDQNFQGDYAGIFHFRFWQFGRWVDVVIDDRLPTYNGQLIFLRSSQPNEFWSALLEKAYAKLHGSYEALKGGSTVEALEDFTGGVSEMYLLNEAPPNLFQVMLKAFERNSLMACSIEADPNITEAQTTEGLVKGHAYSITKVQYVDIQTPNRSGKIPLLRLRNPWGNEAEWNGPWSDKSAEWRFISESEKEEIGLVFEFDGEFWMSFTDFVKRFSRVEICNLSPDSLTEAELRAEDKKKWEMGVFEGEWVRGVTAGGCRNFLETFWHNPQYIVELTDPDEDDEDNKCTILIALMQKHRRSQRKMGAECLTIGFAVYHLEEPEKMPKPLDMSFFKYNASCARSPSFINLREITSRFKLPPGTYVIVPSTFDPNEEGEYILRVFTEKKNHMEENDEEVGTGEIDTRVKDIITPDSPEEEEKKSDKVKEFFLKLAGEDEEVDWVELKEILDYAMRNDVPRGETNPLSGLLSLLCGSFLKDTPCASAFETQDAWRFLKGRVP